MSFFKDFKEDFSQAVNELLPVDPVADDTLENSDEDLLINTLDDVDLQEELDKMTASLDEGTAASEEVSFFNIEEPEEETMLSQESVIEEAILEEEIIEEAPLEEPELEEPEIQEAPEKIKMSENINTFGNKNVNVKNLFEEEAKLNEEVSTITSGMKIKGDIETTGSLNIEGKVNGTVTTQGKLVVTGLLVGDSNSSEFFANSATVRGEINTTGRVKISEGSVIVGNISATSAVIAGAVKGDIDVHGPVVVDTGSVIVGNIKSETVQINTGCVIEGFCSQSYAKIDYDELFGEKE